MDGLQERWATVRDHTAARLPATGHGAGMGILVGGAALAGVLGLLARRPQTRQQVMKEARDGLVRLAERATGRRPATGNPARPTPTDAQTAAYAVRRVHRGRFMHAT